MNGKEKSFYYVVETAAKCCKGKVKERKESNSNNY